MATSNRDRIQKMIELLAPPLDAFLSRTFDSELPDGKDWTFLVAARDARKGIEGKEYLRLDPQVQFRMLTDNIPHQLKPGWYPYDNVLSRAQMGFVTELKEVRNTWAHNGSFTDDDAYRALDTAERLLVAVGAAPVAADVASIRLNLRRVTADKDDRKAIKKAVDTPESVGLRPWREVLQPHEDVATGNFRASEFAADLYKVATEPAGQGKDYADPVEFFRRTYLTEGLRDLIGRAVRRLTGDDNASPVVNLQTNFGGGKTHSMLSLWHIAAGLPVGEYPQEAQELLLRHGYVDGGARPVRRVAIVGNHLAPTGVEHDGTHVNTIWGELAWQLGGSEAYALVAESDRTSTAPGAALHDLLAAYSPAVILIDEWVAYARQLKESNDLPGGTFETQFGFAQSLTEAAKGTPGIFLAISIPASHVAGEEDSAGNTEEVGGTYGMEALRELQNVVRRVADQWRPASAGEAYHIVRQRLFVQPDAEALAAIRATAKSFVEMYRKYPDDFPRESRDAAYEDRIKDTFPIHPELFDSLYEDWSSLERFQRTRGVLRLMNTVIHALWVGNDKSPLIMPGSIPLAVSDVNTELTQYLQDSWKAIIDADVDGDSSEPARIDKDRTVFGARSLTQRLARAVFFGAAPSVESPQKGIERQRVFLGTAIPGDVPGNFHAALTALGDRATYFYSGQGKYWYDVRANISRRAKDQAERMHKEDVWVEILKRLQGQSSSRGSFTRVHVGPEDHGDIPDVDDARLVILHPRYSHIRRSTSTSAYQFAEKATTHKGSALRTYRNMVVYLAPDVDRLAELDTAVREFLAWSAVLTSSDLDLTANQRTQAEEKRKQADDTTNARLLGTYQWVLFPEQPEGAQAFEIGELKADGAATSLAERVSRKLTNDSRLNLQQAASPIRLILNRYPAIWKDGHVSVGELWMQYATYAFMPRLRDQSVLNDGVLDQPLILKAEGFGLADAYEGGRYVGLVLDTGRLDKQVTDQTLVVQYDVAHQQLQSEIVDPDGGDDEADEADETDETDDPQPPVVRHRRFFGSRDLDPARYAVDFKKIADEILTHLDDPSVRLRVTLEVEAINDDGFDEGTRRTVSENATVLKFDQHGFEEDV